MKTGMLAALVRKIETKNKTKNKTLIKKLGYSEPAYKESEGRPNLVEGEETIRKGYTINEGLYLEMQKRMEELNYAKDSEYLRMLILMDVKGKSITKIIAKRDEEIRFLKEKINRKKLTARVRHQEARLAKKSVSR